MTRQATIDSYDRVAEAYADHFIDELSRKPLDRALLAALGEELRGRGPVADLGCGPGHVAAALAAHGVDVEGIDLSAGMVEVARRRFPGLRFSRGDLLALPVPDGHFAGLVAFYAVVHLETRRLGAAFAEMRRALRPGGPALVAFHAAPEGSPSGGDPGADQVRLETWLDQPVDAIWYFHPQREAVEAASGAGLSVEAVLDRAPGPGEHPTRRLYLWLRRPS